MTLATLDLNDAGIDLFLDGELLGTSPGYALLDGDDLLIGEPAAARSRLLTRWSNQRFWRELGLQPLPNATGAIRHHADLALAHLEEIWRKLAADATEAVLAVPAGYDREQLGLLLGIAREAGIPLVGLVEASLAAVASQPQAERVLHLDIQLHRVTLSAFSRGVTLRHLESTTVADTGLVSLMDRWAQIVSHQFIQTSRFDPMHEAATEQALYNQLPAWLEARDARESQPFALELDGGSRTVQIAAHQLTRACSDLYPLIVQQIRAHANGKRGIPLYLSHRWRGFPGLTDALGAIEECRVSDLPRDAVSCGVSAHLDQIRSDGDALAYVTSLAPAIAEELPAESGPAERTPTHLLLAHHAFAIGGGLHIAPEPTLATLEDRHAPHCTVYTRGREAMLDNHSDAGTLVNGELVTGSSTLRAGDTITVGSATLTLISAG